MLVPPGMEDLPNFDRKSLCSAKEIVIKGVDTMTADEVRLAMERRLGQNTGLAHVHVIEGKNVGFARFWSAEAASRALEELKGLKNTQSGRRFAIERCTFKDRHHESDEKCGTLSGNRRQELKRRHRQVSQKRKKRRRSCRSQIIKKRPS